MATEAKRQWAINRFVEGELEHGSVWVRLSKASLGTKPIEVNGSPHATTHGDAGETPDNARFGQATFGALPSYLFGGAE